MNLFKKRISPYFKGEDAHSLAVLALLLFFQIFPLGAMLFHFDKWGALDPSELYWSLKNTFIQSLLSAMGTLLLAIVMVRALFFFR